MAERAVGKVSCVEGVETCWEGTAGGLCSLRAAESHSAGRAAPISVAPGQVVLEQLAAVPVIV